jgi:DNA-binding response OmpR family regulator
VDAVILDYQMPEMNGGQVAKLMKQLRPEVPVMILSALPWLPQEAPRECIDDFVCKGEPTAALVKRIQALMAAHPQPANKSKLMARMALAGRLVGITAKNLRGLFANPKKPPVAARQPVNRMPARIHG